jgi:hypothetical protein
MLAQHESREATAAEAIEAHSQARSRYQQNMTVRRLDLAGAGVILLAMTLGHIGYYAN